jgi:hypothetical protein
MRPIAAATSDAVMVAAGRGVGDVYKVALCSVHSPDPLLPCLSHHFCRLTLLPKLRLLKQRQQVCVAFAPTPRCPPHAPPQPRLPWWPCVCENRARILLWRQQHHNMLPVTVPRIRILLSPRRA